MGLFNKKTKVKLAPRSQESTTGGNWLMNFMKQWGDDVNRVPTKEVANMTPMEQMIGGLVQEVLSRSGGDYQAAQNTLMDIMSNDAKYDPRTGDYYQGLRTEAEDLQAKGVNTIRKGAALGGMLKSTPRTAQEGEFVRKSNSSLMTELGSLFLNRVNQKMAAAQGIGQVEGQRVSNLGGAQEIAQVERAVEQERNNAMYESAMMKLLLPYQQQSQIALAMMGYSPGVVVSGGGLTGLGSIASLGSSILGSYYGSKKE